MSDKATAEQVTPIAAVEELQPPEVTAAPATDGNRPRNLDLILDIPLKVTVELGRTKMIVNDLLALGRGKRHRAQQTCRRTYGGSRQ